MRRFRRRELLATKEGRTHTVVAYLAETRIRPATRTGVLSPADLAREFSNRHLVASCSCRALRRLFASRCRFYADDKRRFAIVPSRSHGPLDPARERGPFSHRRCPPVGIRTLVLVCIHEHLPPFGRRPLP